VVAGAEHVRQHPHHGVGGLTQLRIGDVLHSHVTGAYIKVARMSFLPWCCFVIHRSMFQGAAGIS
jgi:hypothetical protein